jgi:hypothetical protein
LALGGAEPDCGVPPIPRLGDTRCYYGQATARTTGEISINFDPLPGANRYTVRLTLEALIAKTQGTALARLLVPGVSDETTILELTEPGSRTVEVDPASLLKLTAEQAQSVYSSGAGNSARDAAQYRSRLDVVSPYVLSIRPTSIPVTGANVSIDGMRLDTRGLAVGFGGKAAGVVSRSPTQLVVTVPPNLPVGAFVDVVVTHDEGSFTVEDAVRVTPPAGAPVFSGIDVASGPIGGGTAFVINGQNFNPVANATEVFFGDSKAAGNATNVTRFEGRTPPGGVGHANITIATAVAKVEVPDAYYYTGDPVITGFTPPRGPIGGGTRVRITGRGLKDTTAVEFGGFNGRNLVVSGDEIVEVDTPPALASSIVQIEIETAYGTAILPDGFCYLPSLPPTLVSISPSSGRVEGGAPVTVVGTHFAVCDTKVFIGGARAAGGAGSDGLFRGTAPPGVVGFAPVTITTPAGEATELDAFYYEGDPELDSLSPPQGEVGGGTVVTIRGRGLLATASITFGGRAGQLVEAAPDDAVVRVITPPWTGAPAAVDVVVTTAHGMAAIPEGFSYVAPSDGPAFESINVASGPVAGDTEFTITGRNFIPGDGATRVFFGDNDAGGAAASATVFRGRTPPGLVGFADVRITTSVGGTVAQNAFYYTGDPLISSFSPQRGSLAGGTRVRITGRGLRDTRAVQFGGLAGRTLAVFGDEVVEVDTPPARSSTIVQVEVETAHGAAVLPEDFCYLPTAAPTFVAITPASGRVEGGGLVSITGTNLAVCDVRVFIDAGEVIGEAVNDTLFQGIVPAAAVGFKPVTVRTPLGEVSRADAFYYEGDPLVTSVTPRVGGIGGGTLVTIEGRGLRDVSAVAFGELDGALENASLSDTLVRVRSPRWIGAPGAVDVAVTTAFGSTSVAAGFTYEELGELVLTKGIAKKAKTGTWSIVLQAALDLDTTAYDRAAYDLDRSRMQFFIDDTEFFRRGLTPTERVTTDKKTGAVRRILFIDAGKNVAILDLKKQRLTLKLRSVPALNTLDGVTFRFAFAGRTGSLTAGVQLLGRAQSKASLVVPVTAPLDLLPG